MPFLALLSYRATPLPWCGLSPAELLMGRKIRTTLPQTTDSFVPEWPFLQDFQKANEEEKAKQKAGYDRCHRVQNLRKYQQTQMCMWVTTDGHNTAGRTITAADTPRSYIIQTANGESRRNRSQLNVIPPPIETSTATNKRSPILTRSRTGTSITPLERLA